MNAALASPSAPGRSTWRAESKTVLVTCGRTPLHFRILQAAAILAASAASVTVIAYGSDVPALVQFAVVLGTWLLALTAVIAVHCRKQSRIASGISRLMIEAEDRERSRIARELHDDIGQRLSLLTLALAEQSSVLKEQAAEIAADVQSLSHQLHTSHVELLGLSESIRAFCLAFSKQRNAIVQCDIHDLPGDLAPQIGLSLFRVLQEALNNAAKHSGVHRFTVQLSTSNGEVHLRVGDRGRGFELKRAKTGLGLGLKSIEERLKLVGGYCFIETRAGTGTSVEAVVPIAGTENLRIR